MGRIKQLLIEKMDRGVIDCDDCDGSGSVELEVYQRHGFNRDVGSIDTVWTDCEKCSGSGEIEVSEDHSWDEC